MPMAKVLLMLPENSHSMDCKKLFINLIFGKILIKMMLCIFTLGRAKNTTETYLHFSTTKVYKLLYKMQYHLKKNKFLKVLAVRT